MFQPLRTERLVIRAVEEGDAASLVERRNHPAVAENQNWTLPYTAEQAEGLLARVSAMEGPADEEWWMATVTLPDGEMVGDLAVRLAWGGRSAEIGYTLGHEHWGNGYAVESVEALLEYLFDGLGVTRVSAMTHPDNRASAMVLERTGFLFEGRTRGSNWVGDQPSDDLLYGLTRADWEEWRHRPRHPPQQLRLTPIGPDQLSAVVRLQTHKSQEDFVAPMNWSFADALFPEVVDGAPVVPWLRAVEADGVIVGFVMLAQVTEHHPEPYLWRLLIDRMHQRRGIGAGVLRLLAAECRAMGAETLLTSWEEGKGSPAPFYLQNGFELTGRIVDEETEARWRLPARA